MRGDATNDPKEPCAAEAAPRFNFDVLNTMPRNAAGELPLCAKFVSFHFPHSFAGRIISRVSVLAKRLEKHCDLAAF
jgi:hypothetical protein